MLGSWVGYSAVLVPVFAFGFLGLRPCLTDMIGERVALKLQVGEEVLESRICGSADHLD